MAESSQPIQIDTSMLQQYVEAPGSIGWQDEGGIVCQMRCLFFYRDSLANCFDFSS